MLLCLQVCGLVAWLNTSVNMLYVRVYDFSDGKYTPATIESCAPDIVFTDSASGLSVTNWQLTRLLELSDTIRAHVCRIIGGAPDCLRSVL